MYAKGKVLKTRVSDNDQTLSAVKIFSGALGGLR